MPAYIRNILIRLVAAREAMIVSSYSQIEKKGCLNSTQKDGNWELSINFFSLIPRSDKHINSSYNIKNHQLQRAFWCSTRTIYKNFYQRIKISTSGLKDWIWTSGLNLVSVQTRFSCLELKWSSLSFLCISFDIKHTSLKALGFVLWVLRRSKDCSRMSDPVR